MYSSTDVISKNDQQNEKNSYSIEIENNSEKIKNLSKDHNQLENTINQNQDENQVIFVNEKMIKCKIEDGPHIERQEVSASKSFNPNVEHVNSLSRDAITITDNSKEIKNIRQNLNSKAFEKEKNQIKNINQQRQYVVMMLQNNPDERSLREQENRTTPVRTSPPPQNRAEYAQDNVTPLWYHGKYPPQFNTTKIRNNFVQKVYSLLFLQLLITFGFVLLCTLSGTSIIYIAILISFDQLRRIALINSILLLSFEEATPLWYYGQYQSQFDNVKIRNKFVRKVYFLLFLQLLITFGFVLLCTLSEPVEGFVLKATELMIFAMITAIILLFALVCYEQLRRIFPLNLILFFSFTTCWAYLLGYMSIFYEREVVLITIAITAAICLIISLFAIQTKYDVTECGMCLYICLMVLILYGIGITIASFFVRVKLLFLVYSCLVVLLFCAYLMYDTQLIMGGRTIELSPEEYIAAALTLYIDIIMIFRYLLVLVAECYD